MNQQHCGLPSCPICAMKIGLARQKRVESMIESWSEKSECHDMAFITSTMPHNIGQSLETNQNQFMNARRRMKRQLRLKKTSEFVPYSEIIEMFGIIHTITKIEVTVGKNGWHYHSHEIYFTAWRWTDKELASFKFLMVEAWKRALIAEKVVIANDQAFFKRSIDAERVSDSKNISKYISKTTGWDVTYELTRDDLKKGGLGSRSMIQVLGDYTMGKDKAKNARYYKEWAETMHGKQQFFLSRGSSEMLNLDEFVEFDETEDVELSELLGVIENRNWDIIRRKNLRGEVLESCIKYGFDATMNLLEDIDRKEMISKIK
ncbi:MAG: protein rep [Desulfosarcina sp.]|nr:protein rep [Desulfobacterales bacterium]